MKLSPRLMWSGASTFVWMLLIVCAVEIVMLGSSTVCSAAPESGAPLVHLKKVSRAVKSDQSVARTTRPAAPPAPTPCIQRTLGPDGEVVVTLSDGSTRDTHAKVPSADGSSGGGGGDDKADSVTDLTMPAGASADQLDNWVNHEASVLLHVIKNAGANGDAAVQQVRDFEGKNGMNPRQKLAYRTSVLQLMFQFSGQ